MTKRIPIYLILISSYTALTQSVETIIQKGHELAVVCIAISPDSNYIVSGSKDKSIKLWDVRTKREVRNFLGHESTVSSLDFSPDGKYILSGSYDRSFRIWETLTGNEISNIRGEDIIVDVKYDPAGMFYVVAGYNRSGIQDSAFVYSVRTNKKRKSIPINPDEGRGFGVSLSVSNDGKWIGIGEDNRTVNIYRTSTWDKAYTFQHTEGFCGGCATSVEFSPDNRYVYMASHNGPFKKYDLSDGKLIQTYEAKTPDLTGMAVSSDGKWLARSTKKETKLFDTTTGTEMFTIPAENGGEFNGVRFDLRGSVLFLLSDDNTIIPFNLSVGKKESPFTGILNARDQGGLNYDPNYHWESAIAKYVRYKNPILISSDGKSLIKGKFGKKVKQWDIATGKSIMNFTGHDKAVLSYDLSADGTKLLTGGGDGKIILWDLKTGDSLQVIRTYREPIFDIHFYKNETQVLSSSWDASMKIHDLKTKKLVTYFEFESYAAYNVISSPNDLYLVTARLDNTLQLWEPDTKTVIRNFIGHTGIVSSIAFSPDAKTLISSSWDGSIRLWDVDSGLTTAKLSGHIGAIHDALFSADGKSIYSAGADRTIKIWNLSTRQVIRTFTGHQAEITNLVLSPDQSMLISHSVDGVTKFWDLDAGKEFFEHIHLGEHDWLAKNPDGYFNGTDGARKHIHFVSGLKTFSVDQFFEDYYRPDLLPKIFQNRGGSSEAKNLQGKINNSTLPGLKLGIIPTGEGKAEILFKITHNGGGAQQLKLFHNGKNIPIEPSAVILPTSKGQSTTFKQTVQLVGGANFFSASLQNLERLETDPVAVEFFSEFASKSSTCHILAVGINQYKNEKLSLNYAKADATTFSALLGEKGTQLFKSTELHTLYDKDATRKNILEILDDLANKINPEDVFIFYYAGHGSMVDNKFYFIPTETLRLYESSSLNREAIEASFIQDRLKKIKALKQLIIMDACQSGSSVELLANRGASEEKAIAQLSRSAGIHVMASAGSEQFAAEFTELGHGLFTYVLMRGLQGEADGAPKDGKVTIYELKSFIDDQVPEMTRQLKGKPQYPYTFSRGQDFPIVVGEGN